MPTVWVAKEMKSASQVVERGEWDKSRRLGRKSGTGSGGDCGAVEAQRFFMEVLSSEAPARAVSVLLHRNKLLYRTRYLGLRYWKAGSNGKEGRCDRVRVGLR